MANKKNPAPTPQEMEKLLKLLEQSPKIPDAPNQELPDFSPWNVSMKNPARKRTIACSLEETE